jgi:hypothetical protein
LKAASSLVDTYIGRYKNEEELKIGDRSIDELVEIKEKNNQVFRNFRKFENMCKKHPLDEKGKLVYLWCKKMLKAWEDELTFKPNEYLNSADGKSELNNMN